MMQKINARLSQRIAQESQLLAEEKWIINALRRVKQQRNSLQIERFHLDNLRKSVLYEGVVNNNEATDSPHTTSETTVPQPPPPEEPQKAAPPPEENRIFTSLSQFDIPVAGIDDEMINNEQLDLSVTNSVFTNQQFNEFDVEEDEEDFEEDDMEIEMNMLMNSKTRKVTEE